MNTFMKKLILVLFGVALGNLAYAVTIVVDGEATHNGASAIISIDEDYLGEKTLSVKALKLKPYNIYTVWFVNQTPEMAMQGAGSAPYFFATDSRGRGEYKSRVSAYDVDNWQMLKVVLHVDGDAKNMDMDNLQPAFITTLGSLKKKGRTAKEAGSHYSPEAHSY